MTTYTREELRGIRKYKRELRARRQRLVKKTIRFTIKGAIVVGIFYLVGSIFSALGITYMDEVSPLEKYPTPQSYIDHLNSLPGTTEHLTVESVYGDLYKEER